MSPMTSPRQNRNSAGTVGGRAPLSTSGNAFNSSPSPSNPNSSNPNMGAYQSPNPNPNPTPNPNPNTGGYQNSNPNPNPNPAYSNQNPMATNQTPRQAQAPGQGQGQGQARGQADPANALVQRMAAKNNRPVDAKRQTIAGKMAMTMSLNHSTHLVVDVIAKKEVGANLP